MTRPHHLFWALTIAVTAGGLFLLKYEVQGQEAELAELNRAIRADREAIHVLQAEWAYLADPARLQTLATRHLDLAPVRTSQIVGMEALPWRPAPEGQIEPREPAGNAPGGPQDDRPRAPERAPQVAPAPGAPPAAAPPRILVRAERPQ